MPTAQKMYLIRWRRPDGSIHSRKAVAAWDELVVHCIGYVKAERLDLFFEVERKKD